MEDIIAKRWPFVESPGEFTTRLAQAHAHAPLLAAVRTVLIENPPTISKEYLAMAQGMGHCKLFNACNCGGDLMEIRVTCQNWTKD